MYIFEKRRAVLNGVNVPDTLNIERISVGGSLVSSWNGLRRNI